MEALNFRNNYVQNSQDSVQKRLESEENFTALDKEKLKQDTLELTNKAKENANENFVFKTLRNFGVNDPKKFLKSLAMSIGAVIGVAILGNKLTKPAAKLGYKIDDVLTSDKNVLGKCRNAIVNFFKTKVKTNVQKIPKPKFIQNAQKALKEHHASPKVQMFRGYENGAKGIFSTTIVETLNNALEKDKTKALGTLTKLLNGDSAKAQQIISDLASMEKVKFADKLLSEIASANNCKLGSRAFGDTLNKLSAGEFGDGLRFIKMVGKAGDSTSILEKIINFPFKVMGNWWPANAINAVSKKLRGKEIQALQGDLGDSLMKYAAVRGKLGQTMPAKIVQIVPPLVGDYVSNFVNDKSGFGVLLCATLLGNFNKLQDAPKQKKVVTAVNDVASGSLNWLIGMPIAFGTVYGAASLAKMEGKDILTRLGRTIGKFFAVGLNSKAVTETGVKGAVKKAAKNSKGLLGAALRFGLIMFAISPFVSKHIDKLCSKIFGKPYDPAEAEKQKQLEKQRNTIIPELGITQGELQDKIMKNPAAIQKLQNNPELVMAIDKNPKLMLDLLDNKEINLEEAKKPNTATQSPLLQNMIKNKSLNQKPNAQKVDVSNSADLFGSKNNKKTQDEQPQLKDTATYIPSSAFVAQPQPLSDKTINQYNLLMNNSDKVLREAEKYI